MWYTDAHIVCAAGGSLRVMSLMFSSLNTYVSPLIQPVIDQDDTVWPVLPDWDPRTDRQIAATAFILLLLTFILGNFFICRQSELMIGHMIVKWWGRGSSSRGSHPFPSMKTCATEYLSMYQVLAHLAVKGNGKQHSDLFDLCFSQNTPISKYCYTANTTLCSVPHFTPRLSTI